MASLSVRKLDGDVYERLRLRAEQEGVSMEEEVRRILTRAVTTPMKLGQFALECFGPDGGVKLEIPPREPHEPLDFGE